jgi:hypothetical protein
LPDDQIILAGGQSVKTQLKLRTITFYIGFGRRKSLKIRRGVRLSGEVLSLYTFAGGRPKLAGFWQKTSQSAAKN